MSSPLLLHGEVDRRDEEILNLRNQLRRLDEALRLEKTKFVSIESGVRELRGILNPLFNALRKIYGEMDDIQIESSPVGKIGKWDAIKARNPGRIAEAIDILLLHGTMNTNQLKAAMKMNYENCRVNVVQKLSAMGLLVKSGRDFSLREL